MPLSLWRGFIPPPAPRPRMAVIAFRVVTGTGYTVADLLSHDRRQPLARLRQEAMAACYATGLWSLPQVGAYFRRDHTTVLYAVRKVAAAEQGRAAA